MLHGDHRRELGHEGACVRARLEGVLLLEAHLWQQTNSKPARGESAQMQDCHPCALRPPSPHLLSLKKLDALVAPLQAPTRRFSSMRVVREY